MKRAIILAAILVLLLIIGLSMLFMLSADAMHAELSVPLVEDLEFRISPEETAQLFGQAYETVPNYMDTGKTLYRYTASVMGQNARIGCCFLDDRRLVDIWFQWDQDIDQIYNRVYDCLYTHYSSHKDFFMETGENSITLGTDNGVTGLRYRITKNSDSVVVSCVDHS